MAQTHDLDNALVVVYERAHAEQGTRHPFVCLVFGHMPEQHWQWVHERGIPVENRWLTGRVPK